jgi:hypothetical protein
MIVIVVQEEGTSDNTIFTRRAFALGRQEGFWEDGSGDNPAPAKSDDPHFALKPVRVRECENVIRKSGKHENKEGKYEHSNCTTSVRERADAARRRDISS